MDHAEIRSSRFREVAGDALRYWEIRRIVYNCVLTSVVIGWGVLTWPHFRNALTFSSFLKITVLGLLANACYCAAYVVDIPLLQSSPDEAMPALPLRSLAGRNSFRNSAGNLLDC